MWKRSDLYLRKISAVILNIRANRIKSGWSVKLHLHSCLKEGRGMLLSHRTSLKICPEYSNIIGHMCYAASKLWNVCNYERHHYKELGLEKYPDWYYQKKAHKGDLWYRQLPSQTAQETCKQLDKAWKSFYVLKKTGGVKAQIRPVLNREIYRSHICRWGSGMRKAQTSCVCLCQGI